MHFLCLVCVCGVPPALCCPHRPRPLYALAPTRAVSLDGSLIPDSSGSFRGHPSIDKSVRLLVLRALRARRHGAPIARPTTRPTTSTTLTARARASTNLYSTPPHHAAADASGCECECVCPLRAVPNQSALRGGSDSAASSEVPRNAWSRSGWLAPRTGGIGAPDMVSFKRFPHVSSISI